MKNPKKPQNESERLKEVKKYNLLDTLSEKEFDDITKLISGICNVPISLITLLDSERNYLKSHHGVDIQESPRSISFCGHAILESDPIFIIEDARIDDRFYDNPLVTELNAIFYAGVPLINPNGYPIGTLCVFDHKPRILNSLQKEALIVIAKQVINKFELRLKNEKLKEQKNELAQQNIFLQKFSSQVSHDLKSPLANISSLTNFIIDENEDILTEESIEYINLIKSSSDKLRDYIDGTLRHYKAKETINNAKEAIKVKDLSEDIKAVLNLKDNVFYYNKEGIIKSVNKSALMQILLNLVDNAFKYNKNKNPRVDLIFNENENFYTFKVIDNGIGISQKKQATIFDLFETADNIDKNGNEGTGIGLYTVKTLIDKLKGDIWLNSNSGQGTTFTFTIPK